MSQNITYTSDEILDFYSLNRQTWDEFYPSEKWVFERVSKDIVNLGDVFDVGCAGGGLGAALCEQYQLNSYTGIDIHEGIIDWAKVNRNLDVVSEYIAGDISSMDFDKVYDVVVSLGCADWNIETKKIISDCWQRVKPGGYFVVSLRLTNETTINDIQKSYQNINFSGKDKEPEKANYVVTNYREALKIMCDLESTPDLIGGYGYWGQPSATAVTPFKKILFSVFYIRKSKQPVDTISSELYFPADVYI